MRGDAGESPRYTPITDRRITGTPRLHGKKLVLIRCPGRCAKSFLNECVARRADYSAVIVEHDLDWHVLKQSFHAALVQERLHEPRLLHLGHVFCRDAASEENATGGHELQGTVPGLSAEDVYEERQCPVADRGLALQCHLRDQ